MLKNKYKNHLREQKQKPKMKSADLQPLAVGALALKLPLILTIGRIFISPLFLIFYLKYEVFGISYQILPFVLIMLLALSELSDLFDGYLARKLNLVTELGKILDPMADSITRLTMMLTFTQGIIHIPLLLVFVFIYRDTMIGTLRTICALKGHTLAARISGKIKAVLQAIAIFLILVLMSFHARGLLSLYHLQQVSFLMVSIVALYTIFSGIEYIYANRIYIKQAWGK